MKKHEGRKKGEREGGKKAGREGGGGEVNKGWVHG